MQGSTPDSLLALHDAGYREVRKRLAPGIVLDVGCGVGDETKSMTADDRFVVGLDYSPFTVVEAGREHGSERLRFAGMDGARIGVRSHSVDSVVSSHIIEHFTNPVLHVAEIARVIKPDGCAYVLTPNGTADFENPFHVYLFEAEHLVSTMSLFFEEVECLGLEGDEIFQADFASRRASGERLLKLDVFNLRQKLPRRAYVWSYEHVLPIVYRVLGRDKSGIGSGIDASHLYLTDVITERTPVLFAIGRRPRPNVTVTE